AIQYVTCHDNLTMWDKTLLAAPRGTPEDHLKMNKLSVGILAVSQGVMFLHGGHEFGYTKDGEHNSYSAPDSVNSLKWDRLETYGNLNDYTGRRIAIRREHPVYRLHRREEIEKRVTFLDEWEPTPRIIVFKIDGERLEDETLKKVAVLINAESEN